jgi:pimeloyl-ACP methyl ester carboxylesterase
MCHGFPDSWYSWRHQLAALSAPGFHPVAPDTRCYGQSDRPGAIDQYTLMHLVGDMVGVPHGSATWSGHLRLRSPWATSPRRVIDCSSYERPPRAAENGLLSEGYRNASVERGPTEGPHRVRFYCR